MGDTEPMSAIAADLAEQCGLQVTTEHRLGLEAIFDGSPPPYRTHLEGRSALVRDLLACTAVAWLTLGEPATVLYITTGQAGFERIVNLLGGNPHLKDLVRRISRINGAQEITLVNGARVLFRRPPSHGRGLAVDKVIIDEVPVPAVEVFPSLLSAGEPQAVWGRYADDVRLAVNRTDF